MKILGADLGGTKTALMIAEVTGRHITPVFEGEYRSTQFDGLDALARAFLAEAGDAGRGVEAACFAVAGPVHHEGERQQARITNLPWQMSSDGLASALGLPAVRLINDFQAVGYGLDALDETDLVTLQAGEPQPRAPRVLVGAGTGFGHAVMVWQGDDYAVLASEGGHADLAPGDSQEQAFLAELWSEHGHASWERVVSGPGLVWLYEFLARRTGQEPVATDPQTLATDHNAAAAISQAALAGTDPLAAQALHHFARLYGAQAGNLALTLLAQGGVFVAGGIAPKILEWLRRGPFLEAFNAKGRMERLMHAMPVHVVMTARVGLLGATRAGQWAD